ncbi:hypothetical protein C8R46DRAFT_31664 [Mycena filopes]|nr:hypothetical protein C8R46DRAFT_31664 [Mycena filopes]
MDSSPIEFYPPGWVDTIEGKPLMIGVLLSPPLYGIGIAQAAYYYRSFPKDPLAVKLGVGILLLLDTIHIICQVQWTYDWFLIDLLNPTIIPFVFCVALFFAYTTIFLVQCAYAARLWLLSNKNIIVTSLVLLLALGQLAGGLGLSIVTIQSQRPDVSHTSRVFIISGNIELGCSLACDIVITGAMVYFLRDNGASSPIRRTSELVNKIIVYSISVGMLTSVGTIANITLWLALPQNFDFMALHLILSKLYFNSLLVMLNSRVKLRERFYSDNTIDLSSFRSATDRI